MKASQPFCFRIICGGVVELVEGTGACTINLAMDGWKQGGPRLPCSSLRSSRQYSSMCEPAGSMCAPKQAHTDIIRVIQ